MTEPITHHDPVSALRRAICAFEIARPSKDVSGLKTQPLEFWPGWWVAMTWYVTYEPDIWIGDSPTHTRATWVIEEGIQKLAEKWVRENIPPADLDNQPQPC